MSRHVLMIVTSNAKMGNTDKRTGIWTEELAVPYYALLDAGVQVEIASPKGGEVPLDPSSIRPRGQNDAAVERFLADSAAMKKIGNTLVASKVDAATFDAVFFPGGHGTMWDLPFDSGVSKAVEAAFAADKIIAAVCHGPAGLVSAKRPDGKSILSGKRVNAFTDAEEDAAGLSQVVPFKLEARIRELGADFENGNLWQAYAVRDGKLITGQNPASSKLVAQHVLQALELGTEKFAA
ncbi:MAG: type 1 glutamine amidotransferase domain-containing protein [Burkholderiales bacterium]|nr:type 1 glutamine amidotransferase domain-containing protein [Burkholderiales bacterium]